MLRQHVFQAVPEPYWAPGDGYRGESAAQAPRYNHLLAALPPEDYERLLPHLEPVRLPPGATLHRAGDREPYLYFLTEGIVSRCCGAQDGTSVGSAVTGCEGVIGVASFLGGESTPCGAEVVSAGHAYRLPSRILKEEFSRGGALQHLLLRYTQALITQMAQTAACNRYHSVEQQLCRWLLLSLDRLPTDEVGMTQELIANTLGVRREGVTEAAGKLQAAGLIHYRRGRIEVLDRPGLEARACECYAIVKREYDRLLRNFDFPERPRAAPAALAPIGALQPA
ncbi:MAG: Crp/Fnr family transcriptional regulator [Burkholderiales bacterium]